MGKYFSRKFMVWAVASAFVIMSFFIDSVDTSDIMPWWGTVSTLYIGGNFASGVIRNNRKETIGE